MTGTKVGQIWETALADGTTRRGVVEGIADGVGSVVLRFLDDGTTTGVSAAELTNLPDGTWRLVSDTLTVDSDGGQQARPFGQTAI